MSTFAICKCGGEHEISGSEMGKCQYCGRVGCWTFPDNHNAIKALHFATKAIIDSMGQRMTERDVKEILGEINRIQKS